MPTGSSAGGIIVRANRSHIDKKAAAKMKEKMKSCVCFGPVMILTAFGTINPTKPIIPENAEVTATVSAHADNITYLHLLILMPRDFASSSSIQIISKSFAQSKSRSIPTTMPGSKSRTSFQHELDKLPIVHKTIRSSFSLLKKITSDTSPEKNRLIDNPASRIKPGAIFLPRLQIRQKKIRVVAIAPINAQAAVPASPIMLLPAPRKIESAAPNVAPDEIPVMYGSDNELRKSPCSAAPEIPKAPPHKMQQIRRGSLICIIIIFSVEVVFPREKMQLSTFFNGKSTAPLLIQKSPTIGKAARNRKNKRCVKISFLHKSAKTFSFSVIYFPFCLSNFRRLVP